MKRLTIAQVLDGRKKAMENAFSLVKEARLLFLNKHWSRTIYLCQIAGEELGKSLILTSALVHLTIAPEKFDWKRFWIKLRSHAYKMKVITFFEDLHFNNFDTSSDYFPELERIINLLEQSKQLALYTDFKGGAFSEPKRLFPKKFATEALGWAEKRGKLIKRYDREVAKSLEKFDEEKLRSYLKSKVNMDLKIPSKRK